MSDLNTQDVNVNDTPSISEVSQIGTVFEMDGTIYMTIDGSQKGNIRVAQRNGPHQDIQFDTIKEEVNENNITVLWPSTESTNLRSLATTTRTARTKHPEVKTMDNSHKSKSHNENKDEQLEMAIDTTEHLVTEIEQLIDETEELIKLVENINGVRDQASSVSAHIDNIKFISSKYKSYLNNDRNIQESTQRE